MEVELKSYQLLLEIVNIRPRKCWKISLKFLTLGLYPSCFRMFAKNPIYKQGQKNAVTG